MDDDHDDRPSDKERMAFLDRLCRSLDTPATDTDTGTGEPAPPPVDGEALKGVLSYAILEVLTELKVEQGKALDALLAQGREQTALLSHLVDLLEEDRAERHIAHSAAPKHPTPVALSGAYEDDHDTGIDPDAAFPPLMTGSHVAYHPPFRPLKFFVRPADKDGEDEAACHQ